MAKHFLNLIRKKENKRYNNYPLIIMLLSFLTPIVLFIPKAFAQDYTRWELPEHATLRLGKGSVGDITFSSDGKRLYVDSSIGIWTYDAQIGAELNLITKKPNEEVKISPYNNIYVSFGLDNTLKVRDLTDGRVVTSLEMDTEDIRFVVFSPDERTLASVHKEEIHLFDFTTGEQKGNLTGHTGWIRSVAFSPDGSTLVSADSDKAVRLWNVETATYSTILSQSREEISSIVFSPDGKTLISGSSRDTIRLWDVATGTEKLTFDAPYTSSLAVSPDGKTLACIKFSVLILRTAETGDIITELSGHSYSLNAIAFSPDGSTLASGGGDKLFLWDVISGARKMSILGHTSAIISMAFSSDNNKLATAAEDKIHLWNPITGEYKKTLNGGYRDRHVVLTFSADGKTLASQEGYNTHLWDTDSALHIMTLSDHREYVRNSEGGSSSIAFSHDGKLLAGGLRYSTLINLWYMGRTHKATLSGHTGGITSVAFSHDNRFLASGSNDHTVRLWDVDSEREITTFTGHSDTVFAVTFNHDSSIIASGGRDRTIRLWDVATGEARIIKTEHTDRISSVTFSKDGKTIISSAVWYDPTVQLWDVATGEMKTIITGHTSGVYNIAFSADGRTFATGSGDGTVLLWDFNTIMGINDVPSQQLTEDVSRDENVDLRALLLPNYPNPFNPETWIPFQLAKSAHVTLYIYSVDGQLVRRLKLGNKQAGLYHSKNRAAYWDGKNAYGEPVASGIYYYTLSTGEFSATRRMVIRR